MAMIVRAALCALDWNHNVTRPQKQNEFGVNLWKEKVKYLFNNVTTPTQPNITWVGFDIKGASKWAMGSGKVSTF